MKTIIPFLSAASETAAAVPLKPAVPGVGTNVGDNVGCPGPGVGRGVFVGAVFVFEFVFAG